MENHGVEEGGCLITLSKIVLIPVVFFIATLIIKFLVDPVYHKELGLEDSSGIFFAVSVFLGSASYNFCIKLYRMKAAAFKELTFSLIVGSLILVIFLALFCFVAFMLDTEKYGWTYGLGCIFAGVLLVFEVVIIFKFDKFMDKTIKQMSSSDLDKLVPMLIEDKNFIKTIKAEISKKT